MNLAYSMILALTLTSTTSAPGARESATPAVPPSGNQEGHSQLVYVIPVRGMIESALIYVIRRGVAEANEQNAAAVIFVMDTPGGTLAAAQEIIRTIYGIQVPTYTFVERNAFSAGAIIAMATKHIYMAPGSVIGDAMPIMMSPFGGVQEPSEALQEKMVSGVAALIRSAAEQGGHDPELAEAMVRREIEYRLGDTVICPTGQLLTLTDKEAVQPVGPDQHHLLSEGTVKDLDELIETIGLSQADVIELKVTTAERIARFVAALAPLFLIAGLLGVYIEIKTPGFGLPGLLGIFSLAVFFWGHHIAGLAGMEDIVVFLLGVALLLVEILLIPGFGVAGALGLLLMFMGLLSAMIRRYPGTPWYSLPSWHDVEPPLRTLAMSLVGTAAAAVALARFLPKTYPVRRLVLARSASRADGFTASSLDEDLVGLEGSTETALRPSGAALFGDRRLDVITRGEFVSQGSRVRIIAVDGNRIVVEPVGETAYHDKVDED